MITKEAVIAALSQVEEPDLGKDLVTLNMVEDIEIDGKNVSFTVILTTPACPLKELIEKACINAVRLLVDKEAIVKVRLTAKVNSNRKDNKSILPLFSFARDSGQVLLGTSWILIPNLCAISRK